MLPQGKYASVTWAIPPSYGGMTKAMIERSSAFYDHGGVPVDILTFDWRESYGEVRDALRASGLATGVRVLNFWEELSSFDDPVLAEVGRWSEVELLPMTDGPAWRDGVCEPADRMVRRTEEIGRTKRDQYFRTDGTLFLSNELHKTKDGEDRRVRIVSRAGDTVAILGSMRDAYYLWLDQWRDEQTAYLVIDSKYSANWLIDYQRVGTYLVNRIHGSHLADGVSSPYGRLRASRKKAILNSHAFDAVCSLTDRQSADVSRRVGNLRCLEVVPNGFAASDEASKPNIAREPLRGIAVGRLDGGKRMDHAILAVSKVHEGHRWDPHLHIFGAGPAEAELRSTSTELGASSWVKFEGYTDSPSVEFARSSFSLLTSNSEGLPFVLLEAMSTGCIPIAYDIAYGPADIIEDGISGILVPAGDVEALAEAIEDFLSMPEARKGAMRDAAIARVQKFSHLAVVESWSRIFSRARERRASEELVLNARITETSVTYSSQGGITISCEARIREEVSVPAIDRNLFVAFYVRGGDLFARVEVAKCQVRGGVLTFSADVGDVLRNAPSVTLDVFLESESGKIVRRERLPFAKGDSDVAFYGTVYGNMSFHRK